MLFAGKPAFTSRAAIFSAASVLPLFTVVFISISSAKISRASFSFELSVPDWSDVWQKELAHAISIMINNDHAKKRFISGLFRSFQIYALSLQKSIKFQNNISSYRISNSLFVNLQKISEYK
jgi:hypothetical protein